MGRKEAAEQVLKRLGAMRDARGTHGRRHQLSAVLFVSLVAIVAGCNDAESIAEFGKYYVDWFREIIRLPHGTPSQDSILRVFAALDVSVFREICRDWALSMRELGAEAHLAVDGKTLRRSFDKSKEGRAIHVVSAWLCGQGLVMAQTKVDEKSNEIIAIPEVLEMLELKGATVTIDAMGCQIDIADKIIERGGKYVLQVKGNQPHLLEDIQRSFADASIEKRPADDPRPLLDVDRQTDAGHGRIEVRTCMLLRDLGWIRNREAWRGLDGIAVVVRERTDKGSGKTTSETSCFIVGSPRTTAQSLNATIREHWGIENGLHWVLDMTFDEDRQRARAGNAAENLAIARHMALNLLSNVNGRKVSFARQRQRCQMNPDYLLAVLTTGNTAQFDAPLKWNKRQPKA